MRFLKTIPVAILVFVWSNVSFAQTVEPLKSFDSTAVEKNPNESILKGPQFLQGEAKSNREHIERGMTLGELINWLSLIGIIFSAFGVWLALIQIRSMRKQQLSEKILSGLDIVCTTPAPNISPYKDVYRKISEYYKITTTNTALSDYAFTDKDYITRCIARHPTLAVQFREAKDLYDFPVITKRNWLMSNNPMLNIQLGMFRNTDGAKSIDIRKQSKDFLRFFNINNFASYLALKGHKIWNAAIFELVGCEEVGSEKELRLNFALGDYYRYVNNNELLLKELYFELYASLRKDFNTKEIRKLLPETYHIRKSIPLDHVFSFENRPTSVGVSAFVIMNKGDGRYCTFIQRRSGNQVEYPGFFHVAPAGTFQPLSEFDSEIIEKQCNFSFTVLRELLEEVFDLEKADRNKSSDPFNIFKLDIAINENAKFCPGEILQIHSEAKLENDMYKIVPTSFSVDLMTLKPHITFVLIIKTPELYQKACLSFRGNWEGNIKEFDIESNEFSRFIERNLNINGFPPGGAIVLAEGIDYYFTKFKKV